MNNLFKENNTCGSVQVGTKHTENDMHTNGARIYYPDPNLGIRFGSENNIFGLFRS